MRIQQKVEGEREQLAGDWRGKQWWQQRLTARAKTRDTCGRKTKDFKDFERVLCCAGTAARPRRPVALIRRHWLKRARGGLFPLLPPITIY